MTPLTGNNPANTYLRLLQMAAAVDATLRTMGGGNGADSALQLSTLGVNSTGFLRVLGVDVLVKTLARNSLFVGDSDDLAAAVALGVNKFLARASTGDVEAKTISDAALSMLAGADAAAIFAAIAQAATTSAAGVVELATLEEAIAGSGGDRAISSAVLAEVLARLGVSSQILFDPAISSLTGGANTALDSVQTFDVVATGALHIVVIGGQLLIYQLLQSSAAESLPARVRPDDWSAVTNERAWTLLTSLTLVAAGITIDEAGSIALAPPATGTLVQQITLLAGDGAYTSVVYLPTAGVSTGTKAELLITLPAAAGRVLEIRNAAADGALLESISSDGEELTAWADMVFTGAAWRLKASAYNE